MTRSAPSAPPSLTVQILTAAGLNDINYASTHCVQDTLPHFANRSVKTTDFSSLGANLLSDPSIQSVFAANVMASNATETPKAALYVFHCLVDLVIPIAAMDTTVKSWCANGAPSIVYERDTSGVCSHGDEWTRSYPQVLDFLTSSFVRLLHHRALLTLQAGATAQQGCKTSDFSTPRAPAASALGANSTAIFGSLIEEGGFNTKPVVVPTAPATSPSSSASPTVTAVPGSAAITHVVSFGAIFVASICLLAVLA